MLLTHFQHSSMHRIAYFNHITTKIHLSCVKSCNAEKGCMKAFASSSILYADAVLFLLQTIQTFTWAKPQKKSASCTWTRIRQWRGWESDYCSRPGIIAAADQSPPILLPHTQSHNRPPLTLPLWLKHVKMFMIDSSQRSTHKNLFWKICFLRKEDDNEESDIQNWMLMVWQELLFPFSFTKQPASFKEIWLFAFMLRVK